MLGLVRAGRARACGRLLGRLTALTLVMHNERNGRWESGGIWQRRCFAGFRDAA